MLATFALALLQTASKPPVSATEVTKFRTTFAEALADPDGKRGKLITQAKTLEGKYALDGLLTALRAGPLLPKGDPKPRAVGKDKEALKSIGTVTVGFLFESGKDTYGYLVDVPRGYEPTKRVALVLDPGHGTGAGKSLIEKADFLPYFRNAANDGGLAEALVVRTEILEQIGSGGVKGGRPDDEVAAVFDDFFRDLLSRFAVDLDRIYVAGISQTGYWSWYLGRARPDRLAGIAPIAAVTFQVDKYIECYANLPMYVVHGDQDPICKVEQPRQTTRLLKDLGFPVTYVELAGGVHGGAVFGRLGEALAALSKKPRDPWPRRVRRALLTTHAPHAYWLRVTKLDKEGDGEGTSPPIARLDVAVEGQHVTVDTQGVKELEFGFARELLDLDKPIEVTWNKKKVHADLIAPSFSAAVEAALDKADWIGVGPARITLAAPR